MPSDLGTVTMKTSGRRSNLGQKVGKGQGVGDEAV